jgi:hypothetical protein
VTYLPPSLKGLTADRKHIIGFDFQLLARLNRLFIHNGKTTKEELTNLPRLEAFSNRED